MREADLYPRSIFTLSFLGFRAGWFKFTICSLHAYYGEAKANVKQRAIDSELAAKLLKGRMKQKDRWANNSILLGDFNVFNLEDDTFQALVREDYQFPPGLHGQYTNANQDKPFDQMAFIAPDVNLQLPVVKAGVFPFFDHVYRMEDSKEYLPSATNAKYKQWRTFKMSDHLPIWCELEIDFSESYLMRKRGKSRTDERNS